MEMPETADELFDVLMAFKNCRDPNGKRDGQMKFPLLFTRTGNLICSNPPSVLPAMMRRTINILTCR